MGLFDWLLGRKKTVQPSAPKSATPPTPASSPTATSSVGTPKPGSGRAPRKRNEMDRWPEIVEKGAVNPDKKTEVTYTLTEGCMGSPVSIEAATEQYCVYCNSFSDPEFRDPAFPGGGGYCDYWNGAVGMKDSCKHFKPTPKVKSWLSKGYMLNNTSGYPRTPPYHVFDDAPDGERGAR